MIICTVHTRYHPFGLCLKEIHNACPSSQWPASSHTSSATTLKSMSSLVWIRACSVNPVEQCVTIAERGSWLKLHRYQENTSRAPWVWVPVTPWYPESTNWDATRIATNLDSVRAKSWSPLPWRKHHEPNVLQKHLLKIRSRRPQRMAFTIGRRRASLYRCRVLHDDPSSQIWPTRSYELIRELSRIHQ